MSTWSRKNPFPAPLLVNRKLTGTGSEKDTRHYEISLAGSGLTYEVGDSLVVFPTNDPELVDALLRALDATGEEPVPGADGAPKPLREALLRDYAIKQPAKQFLTALVEKAGEGAPLLRELLAPERKGDLDEYLWGMEIIDCLEDHPSVRFTPEEFIKTVRKMIPRLYSIASSIKAHPEQVHLTVATVTYESHGRPRKGVASTYLSERVAIGQTIPVFFHAAKGFRLPEDPATPIIMVGPGTGVAPFRAYLQERKATGATGKNWLFFGEQRLAEDFLYREEFEAYLSEGVLTRLDTAFSRDQAHKIYVQNRLLENGEEIWKWIDGEGAHLYVCGDAARMAKDVDAALHTIVQEHGGKSAEEAALYIEALKKEKRYKRDVY